MTSQSVNLTNVIAPSFYDLHWDVVEGLHTHYWLNGGRGSTKSTFTGSEIVLGMMQDPKANAVCLRQVKDTLKDSVYEQIEWAIQAMGVTQFWDCKISPMVITYIPTGQKILFRGADKPKKIKSIKFKQGYCKYIWFEEVDEFAGMNAIRLILQSLMRGGEEFRVFYTYNPPQSVNNWVNTEVKLTRPDRVVHHSTYLTVPREWLGEIFITEAEHLKTTNEVAYNHEYLGIVTGTGGEVFTNVQIRPITDEEIREFEVVRRGLDFGYAIDPLSYVVAAYNRKYKRLYIYHEYYGVGISNHKAYTEIAKENKRNDSILADSAEPKSISELNQYGLRVAPVKKGPDSVEYGIKFLQDLEAIIIDDQRCPMTVWEFLNYELEKDAQGNFKAKFPDKNNHSIDGVRYAMNYECMQYWEELKKEKPHYNFDCEKPKPAWNHIEADKSYFGGWD